jgi:hypothetical protein
VGNAERHCLFRQRFDPSGPQPSGASRWRPRASAGGRLDDALIA